MIKHYDFLVIGGGVFGLSAAIELAKRKYKVGLINPDMIPHHLAASTDISKAVRMEYGSDKDYFRMAEICIERWKEWNSILGEQLYHEVGFLMLCKSDLESQDNSYERNSYLNLVEAGYLCTRLKDDELKERFPAVNTHIYKDANYNPHGGYVESALAITKWSQYARSIGVDIHEYQTADSFIVEKGRLTAVITKENGIYHCGHAIVAAGVHSQILVPELKPYLHCTGHPVFWLKPSDPSLFLSDQLPVFMADIARTGWYGFPYSEKYGVVKVAKHSDGIRIHPDQDDRIVSKKEIDEMRTFLKESFPKLAEAPLVYTRRCLYTDTLDGHFWIDHHPEIKGLSISTGGSGHGMKMGPILGELVADLVEEKENQFLERFKWRHLGTHTVLTEEARFLTKSP